MNFKTSSSLLTHSIAVVDSAISDVDGLLQSLTVDHVVILDHQQDGVTQLTRALSQYTDLKSVHIFSHGDSASLQLGNSVLSAATIDQYANDLGQWGVALRDKGDILVHGCHVGAGRDGLAFVQTLSQLTGADIAASADLAGQGGDWTLEVATGTIEAIDGEAIDGIDASQLQEYTGTLNMLTNGSFEDNALGAEAFGDFVSIPGWELSTPGGRIELQTVGSIDGDTRVELDSFQNSGMVQSVETVVSDRYQLSFQYTPRPQNALESNGIEVYWDGQLLDTIAEDGSNLEFGNLQWQTYTYEVFASTATTALEFLAVGTSDGVGGLLDDVELEATQAPPETSIQFTDVTAAAGVTYIGESHGAAWGDVNGDGWVDLWTTNHNSNPTLYINQGNGTFAEDSSFTPVFNSDTHGSAFADFDNDGDKDLVVVTGANFGQGTDANQLYVNENGAFSDRAAEEGVDYGFARGRTPLWFDYDNDGKLDLLVSSLYRNDRQGLPTIFRQTDNGFEEVKDETGFDILESRYSLLSDLDRDGRMEVLVNALDRNFQKSLVVFDTEETPFGDVTSEFLPDPLMATDMAIADFNGDLRPDIFATRDGRRSGVAQPAPGLADVFLQASRTEQGIQFSASEDVLFDFFFTFELPLSEIFIGASGINPTSRRFTLSAEEPTHYGILPHSAGADSGLYVGYDVASEQWQVLLSSNTYRRLVGSVSTSGTIANLSSLGFDVDAPPLTERLLINTSQGFVDQSQAAGITLNPTGGESVVVGDFDNDKDVDIYIVGRDLVGNRPNTLYENQGDGTFVEVLNAGGAAGTNLGIGESVIVADYDGDGFLDLFTLNGKEPRPLDQDGRNQLFRNVGNDNNWIELDLEGVISNRDGIGAQVYVTSGGTTQLREQNGGVHKHSQNHTRLHFGLASDTVIDELRIVWPSGVEQVLTNVDVNQILAITEPDDGVPPPSNGGLLINSDFENGVDNWDAFTGTEVISTTAPFSGTNALALTTSGSGVSQVVNVVAGETYLLDVMAKTNASGWSGFGVNFFNANWVEIESTSLRISTTDWEPYSIEAVAPANAVFSTVWVFKGGDTGVTNVDDFNLEIVEVSTPLTSEVQDTDDTAEPGIIFSDDFENSQGWVVNPTNSDTATTGQWEVVNPEQTALNGVVQQLGTTVSGSQSLVTDGTAGTNVGSFDVDNGLTSVRSPLITLPDAGRQIRLSFSYYLAHLDSADVNDFLRVTVVGERAFRVVLLEQGNETVRAARWTDFSADISDFAGQTVTLLLETQDGGRSSLVEASVDDVVVEMITDAPPLPSSFRIEAEDFNTLQNYSPQRDRFASGGEWISVNNRAGIATTAFTGTNGFYNIVVGYYDENDGNSRIAVQVNGNTLDVWTLDNSPGGNVPNADNLIERTVATNIFLSVGDLMGVLGARQRGELAGIDYVDFIAVG